MFKLRREKETIYLDVEPNIEGAETWYYTFSRVGNSEPGSQMLINAINRERERRMKDAREAAYNQGWSDAKAKRKRETWFSGWL